MNETYQALYDTFMAGVNAEAESTTEEKIAKRDQLTQVIEGIATKHRQLQEAILADGDE